MIQTLCHQCGTQNPDAPLFCSKCGASLEPDVSQEQTQSQAPERYGTQPVPTREFQHGGQWQRPPIPKAGIGTGIKLGIGGCVGVMLLMGACAGITILMAERNMDRNSTPQSVSPARETTSGINLANYNRLREGMSYNEVVNILRAEGTELSSNSIGGNRTVMYQWKGSGFGNMNAIFQNGKLISKAQFGLQ